MPTLPAPALRCPTCGYVSPDCRSAAGCLTTRAKVTRAPMLTRALPFIECAGCSHVFAEDAETFLALARGQAASCPTCREAPQDSQPLPVPQLPPPPVEHVPPPPTTIPCAGCGTLLPLTPTRKRDSARERNVWCDGPCKRKAASAYQRAYKARMSPEQRARYNANRRAKKARKKNTHA